MQLANHQTKSDASDTSPSNNYLTEAVEASVFIPKEVHDETEKTQLVSIVYSVRHNMQILQTSAAKICHEIYRAKQLFGDDAPNNVKNYRSPFIRFALANFFPLLDSGEIDDTVANQRRVRQWVKNGALIEEYFRKSGLQEFDRFKKLTMAALESLASAPEEIAMEALNAPAGATPLVIKERVEQKQTGSLVATEMEFISREIRTSADANTAALAEALDTAKDLRERVVSLQTTKIRTDKELSENGAQIINLRQHIEGLKKELEKAQIAGDLSTVTRTKSAMKGVEHEERGAKLKLEALLKQQAEVQQRLNNITGQLQASESIVGTVNQLRDDITVLLTKYPSALRTKMEAADKRVAPILKEIATNLRALANQLSPEV